MNLRQSFFTTDMLATLIIVFAGVFMCSCSSDDDAVPSICDYEISDKIEVDMNSSQYLLIKSQQQLESLFEENVKDLKKIDFKTYNLLYIQGKATHGIAEIQSGCVYTENVIKVNIEIKSLLTTEYSNWNQAFLIPKTMVGNISVSVNMIQ